MGHLESCPGLLRGLGTGASWRKGTCETGTIRGRLVSGRKEQMSKSTSGYHRKGTQELSEVRVGAGPGPNIGLLSSLREKL